MRREGSAKLFGVSKSAKRRDAESEPETYEALVVTDRPGGARFSLHAKPRSSRSAVLGVREGALDVAIAAPPVDGAANDEIRALLARALAVPKRDVEIISGASGRSKLVEVSLSAEETRARLRASRGRSAS